MAEDRLVIAASVDAKGVSRGLTQAVRMVEASGQQLERAWGGFRLAPETLLPASLPAAAATLGDESGEAYREAFLDQLEQIGRAGGRLQSIGNRLSLAITAPVVGFGGLSAKLAADAIESASKFEQVFGGAAASAQAALDRLYPTTYATRAQLQDMASEIGALARGFGAAAPEAASFATNVVDLARDIASFSNVNVTDVLSDLRSGMVGEAEPLRKYGVALSEAAVQAEAARLGFLRQGETLTALGRAQAAFSLTLQATTAAQGDAARTADSAANRFKDTRRTLQELSTTIGQRLLPQLVPLAESFSHVLTEVNQLDPALLQTGIKVAAVGAAIGPVLTGVGTLTIAFSGLTRAAVAAQGAVTGLSGAAALGRLAAIAAPVAVSVGVVAAALHKFEAGAKAAHEGAQTFLGSLPKMDASELQATIADEQAGLELLAKNREELIGRIRKAGLNVDVDAPTTFQRLASPMVQDLSLLNQAIEDHQTILKAAQAQYAALGGAVGQTGTATEDFAAQLRASFDRTLAGIKDSLGSLSVPDVDTHGADAALRTLATRTTALAASFRQLPLADSVGTALPLLTAAGRQVEELRARLATLEATDPFGQQTTALREQIRTLDEAQTAWSGYADVIRRLPTVPVPELGTVRAVQIDPDSAIGRKMAEQGRQVERTVKAATAFKLELRAIAAGARGVTQVADAFGRVDDNTRRALDGAAGLLSSVVDIREELESLRAAGQGISGLFGTAAGLGGIVGAIGGAASLFAGLKGFLDSGPSPEELAAIRATQDNTAELAKVRAELSGLGNSLHDLGSASQAARALPASLNQIGLLQTPLLSADEMDRAAGFITRFGVSLGDLERLADDYGITLMEGDRIIRDAVGQLADRLDVARDAALQFARGLQGITDRQNFLNAVNDVDQLPTMERAQVYLDQSAAVFQQLAPDLYDLIFGGVDQSTAEGRAIIEQRTRDFVERLTGAVPNLPELFKSGDWGAIGGAIEKFTNDPALAALLKGTDFENINEIVQSVLGIDSALDLFDQATRDATDSLNQLADINLPPGFRKGLAEWASTLPDLVDLIPPAPPAPTLPTVPPPPTLPPATAGRDRTSTGDDVGRERVVTNMTFAPGSIVISGANKSAGQLFDELEAEGRKRARSSGGARTASTYTLAT